MDIARPFTLRSRKLWIGVLTLSLAWMWWSALGKKSVQTGTPSTLQKTSDVAAKTLITQEATTLPAKIERESLEASSRDPFSTVLLPAPKLAEPKKAPSQPIALASIPQPSPPQAVAAPSPPPLNLRFLGQATAPDGERMIYAALGDTPVLLTKGVSLSNGYQVTSIEPKLVNLLYTPLNFSAQLALPEPPRYEIR